MCPRHAQFAYSLTLKAPLTTAADDIHKYFFIVFQKISLGVSSESSARQRIHLKHQALFSSKDKSKKLKCRLLQFLFGASRVKEYSIFSRHGSYFHGFGYYVKTSICFTWGGAGGLRAVDRSGTGKVAVDRELLITVNDTIVYSS